MGSYLTSREERELAQRMAADYLHHDASIRVLMFQEGLSYGTVRRLLTQVARIDLRRRGGRNIQIAARDQFDDLEPDQRQRLAEVFAGAFVAGTPITTLAQEHGFYPYTVLRLIQQTGARRPRRLDRAAYGSRRQQ